MLKRFEKRIVGPEKDEKARVTSDSREARKKIGNSFCDRALTKAVAFFWCSKLNRKCKCNFGTIQPCWNTRGNTTDPSRGISSEEVLRRVFSRENPPE